MLKRIVTTILIIAALWAASRLVTGALNPYYLQISIEVGIAIILAVSLNLINGFTGQFSLGHAGFAAVGAYSSAAITFNYSPALVASITRLGVGEAVAIIIVFIAMLLLAALVAALFGLLVGLPSLRLRGDYLAIATLGFGEIIRLVINNRPEVGGAAGFAASSDMPQFVNLFWVYLFVIIVLIVSTNLLHSVHGRALLSIREDELAASVMGVPTTRYKVMAFVIGAAFAGIAGCLTAHYNRALSPNDFDLIASVMIVVVVVLGGMGSIVGVTIAAVLLQLLSYALRSSIGLILGSLLVVIAILGLMLAGRRRPMGQKFGIAALLLAALVLAALRALPFLAQRAPELRMLLFSALLIVIMLTRPQGLLIRGKSS
jgi:branched-chain amino acid transport system permease protein